MIGSPMNSNPTQKENQMDRKDAARGNIKVIEKPMAFASDFVTCTNCGCNYGGVNFCQKYSMAIDPGATKANEEQAEKCIQWLPSGLNRNKAVTPDHTYHYED